MSSSQLRRGVAVADDDVIGRYEEEEEEDMSESLFNPTSSSTFNDNYPGTPTSTGMTRSESDSSSNYYSADEASSWSLDRVALGLGSSPRTSVYIPHPPQQQQRTPPVSHTPSVLPSPSFFHPRKPSTVPSTPSPQRDSRLGNGNGPLVIRRVSEFDLPGDSGGIGLGFGNSSRGVGEDEGIMMRESSLNSDRRAGTMNPSNIPISIPEPTYSSPTSLSNLGYVNSISREPLLTFPISGGGGSPSAVVVNRSPSYGEALAGMRATLQKARTSIKSTTSPAPTEVGDFGRHQREGSRRSSRKGGMILPDEDEHMIHPLPPIPVQYINPVPKKPRPTTILLDTSGKPIRNHQLHSGSNRFFWKGKFLSSKDSPLPFIICLAIAIILPILFFVFSAEFLWTHLGGGGKTSLFIFAWLAAVMLTNMLKTSWQDPGIIPRNLDPNPDRKWVEHVSRDGTSHGDLKPQVRYMRLKDGVVASKWCDTCATYRPPRTSHCRLCDNCVQHTDHHCTFLNNCVGRRNYTSFIVFLISSILSCVYVISFSIYHISTRHSESLDPTSSQFGINWSERYDSAGSFFVAIVAFLVFVPLGGLFAYHMILLGNNRTTIEMLRPKGERSGAMNPLDGKAVDNVYTLQSPWANFISVLCRPMEIESWIEGDQFATSDDRLEWESQSNRGEV